MELAHALIRIPDASMLALVTLTFIAAGAIKGVVGLGLPTIAMGLLSIKMTPTEAASILLVPSFVTNAWQLAVGPSFLLLARRLWPMLAGIFLGTLAGGALLPVTSPKYGTIALGFALLLYASAGLASFRMSVPPASEGWMSPVAGALTGIVTAATGVFVVPAVPYLQGLGLDKDRLVQALGLAFTVSTIALGGSLAIGSALEADAAGLSLYALVPALLGMSLGQMLRSRIRQAVFRKSFFVGLLLLGAHLAFKPFIS